MGEWGCKPTSGSYNRIFAENRGVLVCIFFQLYVISTLITLASSNSKFRVAWRAMDTHRSETCIWNVKMPFCTWKTTQKSCSRWMRNCASPMLNYQTFSSSSLKARKRRSTIWCLFAHVLEQTSSKQHWNMSRQSSKNRFQFVLFLPHGTITAITAT